MAITANRIKSILNNALLNNLDLNHYVSCTFRHYATNDSYNPSTKVISNTPVDKTVRVILSDFSITPDQAGIKEFQGNTVLDRDKKIILESIYLDGIEPRKDDQIILSDVIYNVVGINVDPYKIAWILHGRPDEDL